MSGKQFIRILGSYLGFGESTDKRDDARRPPSPNGITAESSLHSPLLLQSQQA